MVDRVDKMDIKGMLNMKDITDIGRYDLDGVHVGMVDMVNFGEILVQWFFDCFQKFKIDGLQW